MLHVVCEAASRLPVSTSELPYSLSCFCLPISACSQRTCSISMNCLASNGGWCYVSMELLTPAIGLSERRLSRGMALRQVFPRPFAHPFILPRLARWSTPFSPLPGHVAACIPLLLL